MGVGKRVPGTRPSSPAHFATAASGDDGVTLEGLRSAILAVLSEDTRESAERYRLLLGEEDGVETACAAIVSGVGFHV